MLLPVPPLARAVCCGAAHCKLRRTAAAHAVRLAAGVVEGAWRGRVVRARVEGAWEGYVVRARGEGAWGGRVVGMGGWRCVSSAVCPFSPAAKRIFVLAPLSRSRPISLRFPPPPALRCFGPAFASAVFALASASCRRLASAAARQASDSESDVDFSVAFLLPLSTCLSPSDVLGLPTMAPGARADTSFSARPVRGRLHAPPVAPLASSSL